VKGSPPDLILVVLDTLPARTAGLEREPSRMPTFARLAAGGAWFRHAVSNSPWTYPAHGSLFTGLYPSEHGMEIHRHHDEWDRERERPDGGLSAQLATKSPAARPDMASRWLPNLLAQARYTTVMASNNPWISRVGGFQFGFSRYRDFLVLMPGWVPHRLTLALPRPLRRSKLVRTLGRGSYHLWQSLRGHDDFGAERAVQALERWLPARDPHRPLFLFVNLIEAHAPYLSPAVGHLARSHPLDAARAVVLSEARFTIHYNLGLLEGAWTRAAVLMQRRMQERAAAYLDQVLARILAAAKSRRDAIVIVTSDHGEAFGEAGYLTHGESLIEPVLHVPLVVAGPGIAPVEQRDTVDLRRVYSTVLQLARSEVPGGAPPGLFEPSTQPVVAERDRTEFPEWVPPDAPRRAELSARMRAVYRDPFKLVIRGDQIALHDLATDPTETRDLAAELPHVVEELRRALPEWPAGPADGTRPPSPGLTAQEEAELAQHLEALGYLA
jgi:arylsulfatase A-like enzyme